MDRFKLDFTLFLSSSIGCILGVLENVQPFTVNGSAPHHKVVEPCGCVLENLEKPDHFHINQKVGATPPHMNHV